MVEPDSPPLSPPAPSAARGKRGKSTLTPRGARSPRALAARRANLLKARAAPKEILYRSTEKRRAASRANLQKAIAARRSPLGNASARLNALKHGLFAQEVLSASLRPLGEDPKEFAEHLELFERVYVPQDDEERRIIRSLAETTWRRLRLFHAQARWESARLKKAFRSAPAATKLSPEETEGRALALVRVLSRFDILSRETTKLQAQVERALRHLLLKRSGGTTQFAVLSRRDPRPAHEIEREKTLDMFEKLLSLTPRERATFLEKSGLRDLWLSLNPWKR